jgi:hypothetical protein
MADTDRIGEMVTAVSFPKSWTQGSANDDVVCYVSLDGEVSLVWDKPHAGGHTTHALMIGHEDIPEFVGILLGIYTAQRNAQQARDALAQDVG